MGLSDKVTEGRHLIRMTYSGVVEVEAGEELTVSEAIDEAMTAAGLIAWEVDGE